MSTECESVVSPTLGSETLPHPLTLPSNGIRNERHAQSGISYEGRLSLISPLNSYEATMRAAFGIEHPSNHHPTPHLLSPPFTSQVHGFPNPDSLSFPFPEDSRRSIFNIHPPSHSTPGSSRDFVSYGQYQNERVNENDPQIKQESVDPDLHMYRTEPPKSSAETSSQDQDVFRSSGSRHTSESSPEGATESSGKRPHNLHELTREPSVTSSVLNMETITEKDYMINGDNSSDPGSPFVFQENDDGPCSTESDQHDSREVETDPMSFMNTSFDGSQEGFHGENSKSLKCQFCSYSTDSKIQLGSHLNSHFDHKCMKCEFTTRTIEQLKDHLQEEHELTPEDVQDLESIRVPRVNSQGKVKTFKCKQCGYVAVTKSDFWKHAKTHIKSEKLLSCRKCPFVTEYKHHLEYHMRNHFGSKPYKCNKCSYSCVNKSMLNSHMKSHSNIYQYRCSDCTYATKYCHSLKLHLRKYGHTPAMVLNPDGTPNPVPIIDIYGTRRGPKLKKDENGMPILPPQYQLQAQYVRAHMEVTGTIPPAPIVPPEKLPSNKVGGSGMHLSVPPPPPPFPNPFSFTGNVQNYPSFIPHEFKDSPQHMQKNDTKENTNESSEKEESLNASKSPEVEESLKCEICNFSTQNKDILSHHMLLHVKDKELEKREVPPTILENDGNDSASYDAQKETSPISPPPSFPKEQIKHAQTFPPQLSVAQNTLQEYFARAMNPLLYPPMMSGQSFVHSALEFQQQIQRIVSQTSKEQSYQMKEKSLSLSPIKLSSGQAESVLDLSKEQTPPNVVSSSQQHSSSSTSPSFFLASPPSSDISTPPSKSRRKGRAFKIERIALRLSGSGEEGESSCNEGSETQRDQEGKRTRGNGIPPLLPLDLPESKDDQSADVNGKWGEAHQCQYCDIAFKDVVMYTMHMGYHGYKDPFTCNMCGFDAADKLAFFLHIGRSSHL